MKLWQSKWRLFIKSLQADSLQLPVPKPLPRGCSPHLASPTLDCQVS